MTGNWLAAFVLVAWCGGIFVPAVRAQLEEPATTRGAPADADGVQAKIADVEKRLPQIPDRGAALYFLAAAKQHLGETLEALKLLKECLALHEGFDPAGSAGLKILKGDKEFDDLVAGVHRDFPVEAHARGAFVSEEKDLIPEGLAYDAQRNVFYLSSLLRRKIVKISAEGRFSEFVPAGRERLLPILGIRVDPNDGTIWADSWDDAVDRSELLHFDGSGYLLGRFAPRDTAKHGFNDLVVMKNGMVFLTDSVSNQVLRFDPKAHAFNTLAVYRELSGPNGIAVSDDEQQMFVADDFGVVKVELRDGQSAEVDAGGHNTLAGIDGLYWYKGSLIGVQNGIGSPRIAAFRLSADRSRVTKATALENRSAYMDQPTTGAIRGDSFYFIVNSQGGNLNGDHVLDVTTLARVRIAVLRLP
ncbi:MAG: hypothetical protein ABSG69_16150 [Candidatus Acidiferrum sp.]|jgi:hypothetical protein